MSLSISKQNGACLPTFSRQISQGDQLITFQNVLNPRTDFDQLSRLLDGTLDEKESQCLADIKEYLIKKEDAWILDQKLLNFIGGLLEHRQVQLATIFRISFLLLVGLSTLKYE